MAVRRAKRPLDPNATSAADEQIYAAHADDPRPNALYDADGNRTPLSATDPSQAALRREWMDYYIAAGGQIEGEPEPGTPDKPVEPCCADCTVEITNETGGKACAFLRLNDTCKFKAVGSREGGTYSWAAEGKVSVVGSNAAQVVEVKGDSVSAALEDSKLTVTYTVDGCVATKEIKLTVADVKKITATITATPPITARLGNAPADHTFESTETAANWTAAKTLVMLRADLRDVALKAEVEPVDAPLTWKVERASDDHASLGAGVPGCVQDGADDKKATLDTDETGSFLVRAFVDCDGDGAFGKCDPFKVLQVVLVEPRFVADNSATHTGHIAPVVDATDFSISTGNFDIANPGTEAIHMNVTVDVVSGGAAGRRLLECVFAGWVNNERANENIRGSYAGGHARFSVFANNRAAARGPGRTFLPGDPAPAIEPAPFLDTGRRPQAARGTGGNMATLTSSRVRTKTNRAVGQRWIVEAIDSPGDHAPLSHPAFGTRLERFHFELAFSGNLSFWTNNTQAEGATGDPCDRVYAAVRTFDWDMLGEWTVSAAGAIAVVTPMSVTRAGETTHNPAQENDAAGVEVRAPSGLDMLANDATT